jgi:hypothetical protein
MVIFAIWLYCYMGSMVIWFMGNMAIWPIGCIIIN